MSAPAVRPPGRAEHGGADGAGGACGGPGPGDAGIGSRSATRRTRPRPRPITRTDVTGAVTPLHIVFTATLERIRSGDTWLCVQLPDSAARLGTRGQVRVEGAIDAHPFHGSFMPLGDGTHKLPIAAAIRRQIRKREGDTVDIELTARLD